MTVTAQDIATWLAALTALITAAAGLVYAFKAKKLVDGHNHDGDRDADLSPGPGRAPDDQS